MENSNEPEIPNENLVLSNEANQLKKQKSLKNKAQQLDNKIVNTISELLKNMCKENNSVEVHNTNILYNKKIILFMLKKIPSISIKDFLFRLLKYSKISDSTLVYILIYIDRLCHKYKIKLNYYNIYKLILASMVVAIKLNEDEFYSSEFYAKLGGISKIELNNLEYEFTTMINFNLFVKEELFYKYYDLLINYDME